MDEDRNMTEVVDNADGNSVLSDISTMEDEDAEDVSLVEYARYYGLCQDYTLTNPLDPSGLPSPSPSVHPSSDDLQLPELSSDFMGEEKCTLDIASAKFLRSIALSQMEEEFDDLYDHHSKEDAKIEGPLLRTDAELDLKRFCRIRKAEDNLNVISFGSFDADQTEEPKLEWLDSELPAKKDLEAHTEKLQLNKAAVDFLKDVCVHTEMGLDDALLLSGELVNRRRPESGLVTPPLLPISPLFMPADPPSPVNRLEIATSPVDPTAAELDALEAVMMAQDAFSLDVSAIEVTRSSIINSDDICTIYPPLKSALRLDSSSPLKLTKRERPEDLKVEVPLTPPMPQPSPTKKLKTVSFSEDLNLLIPEFARTFSPDAMQDEDYNTLFGKTIQDVAESAIHEVNHEQLSEADSVMRVEVPMVDHSVPPLPWKLYSRKPSENTSPGQSELDAQRQMFSTLKKVVLKNEHQWPGVSMINKALDRWEPFPDRLGRVDLIEQFDDGSGGRYLSGLIFAEPDVSSLLWKLEGLRILDGGEDDDYELEEADLTLAPAKAEPPNRGIDHSKAGLDELCQSKRSNASKFALSLWNTEEGLALIPQNARKRKTALPCENVEPVTMHQSILGANAFSADASLGRFMHVQTGLAPEFEPPKKALARQGPMLKAPDLFPLSAERESALETATEANIPLPAVPISMPPRSFIVPTEVLAQRREFVREIERLYPEVVLVERDFAARASVQGRIQAPCLEEADVLISPGTGILLTTLQKIKQKSLPGQKNHAGVRERMMVLAPRYEQLIVLVSEGQPASTGDSVSRTLDERDCQTLSSLIGYTTLLGISAQIFFVPGGETALARWTVSCMARHSIDNYALDLQQDETFWELFLRQAGMNAFAAQAVLGILKVPAQQAAGAPIDSAKTDFGLTAFLHMTVEERVRKFGALMGGDGMLRRVSSIVDGQWVSGVRA